MKFLQLMNANMHIHKRGVLNKEVRQAVATRSAGF